MMEQTKR